MELTVQELADGVAIVSLDGRLNMVTAGRLRDVVSTTVESGFPRVVVDLSGVDFIDSSGLGALISGLKTARLAGGDLRITAPTEQVQLVLQLTNMERVLPAFADSATAFSHV
jgi:anti-sigma B factor antagonist